MRPLNIIITTQSVSLNGGGVYVVRDLALGLMQAGHRTAIVAHGASSNTRSLADYGIPVFREWGDVPIEPDIIHGHGNLLLPLAGLLHFPHTPALHHFDAALPFNAPVMHPRIYLYSAITESMRLRVVTEGGIPESSTMVIANTVDTDRFSRVRRPPETLTKALFYNGYHRPGDRTVEAVKSATARAGIEVDFVGRYFGDPIDSPETVLPEYDLVFACGLSALEALACGCAVILLGITSADRMVTLGDFDRLRAANFAAPLNAPLSSAESLLREIERYSPTECAQITQRVREECASGSRVEMILGLYDQVVRRHREAAPAPLVGDQAILAFLRRTASLMAGIDYVEDSSGDMLRKDSFLRTMRLQQENL